jgi:SAM-dependent methyltransferase
VQRLSYNAKKYWGALLEKSFDEAGVCWPKWPLSYNRHLHRQQKEGFETLLHKQNISLHGRKVFEIGPGNGFWSGLFSSGGVSEYRGFDITKNSVEKLSRRYPDFSFEECDFSEYSPKQSEIRNFDLAMSVLVFLHITDNAKFEACFENAGEMLKKGGYFIVLDAVSQNTLRGKQQKMADGASFDITYHNKVRYMDYYTSVAAQCNMELIGYYPAFNITQNAFDFKSGIGFSIGSWYFNKILNPILIKSGEKKGEVLGKILVALDKFLFASMSSSSKWLVFRKRI